MVIKSLMQIFANTQLEINRKGSNYHRVRGSDIKIEINTFFTSTLKHKETSKTLATDKDMVRRRKTQQHI